MAADSRYTYQGVSGNYGRCWSLCGLTDREAKLRRFWERVHNWKELARDFLLELYTLRQIIDSINQRYYEGQQVPFPKVAEGLDELVHHTERLVGLYNRNLAEGLDHLAIMLPEGDRKNSEEPFRLEMEVLQKLASKPVSHQTEYLVDMAKVEAHDTMGENRKTVELLDQHV
ncbi:MAG: hypothetical protein ACE5Q6_15685 [Dehalococcoidia bacterium]